MIKNYFFTLALSFAGFYLQAQIKVQGELRNDLKIESLKSQKADPTFSFDDVKYWVGTGANKAAVVIQWNKAENTDAIVWGYRFDGEKSGTDMLLEIAKNDPRLYLLVLESTGGTKIGGVGFDADNKGALGLVKDEKYNSPYYITDGVLKTSEYDFDQWTNIDNNDYWAAGWIENGFWTYWTKEQGGEFDYSGIDSDARLLVDGSWDVWNFATEMEDFEIASTFNAADLYVTPTFDYNKGVFIVNEDWFGQANGSVNFVAEDGQVQHNSFKQVNPTEEFGVTTQFGTIYGDNFYFVSKQGNRLVVADAKTLTHKKSFATIGGKDGRAFLGVNPKMGYIGTGDGIFLFDIENLTVGSLVEGTNGGQIGNMIRTANYVFAAKQNTGILVIDPKTNEVIQTIEGAFISVVQTKDGNVWGALADKLVKINPLTFTTEEVAIPTKTIPNSWGAWNAGSFSASTQKNELYFFPGAGWSTSATMVKYDVETNTFNEDFLTLPNQELANTHTPYGAALRVDPRTDELIVTAVQSGWGANSEKNWVHRYSNNGEWISTVPLSNYYWFPALPVFPDVYAPEISGLETKYSIGTETVIDLNDKANDDDNIQLAIVKELEIVDNDGIVEVELNNEGQLIIKPLIAGIAHIKLSFISNGKVVEQAVEIDTNILGVNDMNQAKYSVYPNPVSNVLFVESTEIATAVVYNLTGAKVFETKIQKGKNQIDVASLSQGVYVLKVNNQTYKIIKK